MKRCPECRRDYYDDSLIYCLDDGNALVYGPGEEAKTAVLDPIDGSDNPTRKMRVPVAEGGKDISSHNLNRAAWIKRAALAAIILSAGSATYWFAFRDRRQEIAGSFRVVNSPAYDYYLRGKLDSTSQNRQQNENAIRILEDVVAVASGFAPAYASLARAYGIKADLFAPVADQKKLYDDARHAAEKALAIDPSLAEAHLARGAIIWNHVNRFPHEQAVRSYKKAIALQPELDEAHHLLGLVYYHMGLLNKAEQALQKSMELNPSNSLVRFRLGLIAAYSMDNDKALKILKTVPSDANSAVIDRAMAGVLFQLGRTDEAWRVVEAFLASNSDEGGNVTSVKAMLLAQAGRRTEAEAAIQQAISIGQSFQHFHHATYNIASAYALLNNPDEALRWLRVTADEGFPCYPLFEKDPNLINLRGDARFVSMMTELRQQWKRYHEEL